MKVTYCTLTNKGDRTNNEDRVISGNRKGEYCFALADGLGGHEKGEVASTIVTEITKRIFMHEGYNEFFIREAFEISQEKLKKKQVELDMEGDMKTTLVILGVSKREVNWGHIGDSRLYHFQNNRLVKHTFDHSVPQMLVNIGEIEEKDIRNHPDRSMVLKVMGMEWEHPLYEIAEPSPTILGQSFLMCTDGFWENINEEDMTKCLKKSKNVYEWIELMDRIIIENSVNKSNDNYSAIGVWIR